MCLQAFLVTLMYFSLFPFLAHKSCSHHCEEGDEPSCLQPSLAITTPYMPLPTIRDIGADAPHFIFDATCALP